MPIVSTNFRLSVIPLSSFGGNSLVVIGRIETVFSISIAREDFVK